MAAEREGDNVMIMRFNYTDGRRVPRDATHITVDQSVRAIPAWAFYGHINIVEVIFGLNVEKVEGGAFAGCSSLRRVIMPGVEVVEGRAFINCDALTYIECGKLEIIENNVFHCCTSLSSIDLPSAITVKRCAFWDCEALTDVKFGKKLGFIEELAFMDCTALERITIPLKDGLIADDNIFVGCDNLKQVDLVEGPIHETIAALQLDEWRNDINEEIGSINQILPTVDAGRYYIEGGVGGVEVGEKARAIRTWIRSVLRKAIHYKAEHQRLLDEQVATALELALPRDIVMNNVLPFLKLPSYTFEVGDHEEGEEQDHSDGEEEDDEE
eukprot:scaffold7052_cov138-Skeletonema_dohrnii-CCMP3373.AAC.3